ncbi:hypothetical protein SAMN05444166_1444 [Singulisphaera sp. GP187]|uniref:hypothetical protein n=1 Tax=Singulisphaera sp. GP187 TaxID=1882752 RepID=UPI000927F731|nr:hypothetical protein [Singulisphaera sp. GP187]SIN88625.1 hypothetical protein SAMN05444166_1444 [Singulisphaera sp. GP187]
MGEFFDDVLLPTVRKLVEVGLSYDEVKRLLKIPATWGAKISGEGFDERASDYIKKRPGNVAPPRRKDIRLPPPSRRTTGQSLVLRPTT